MSYLRLIQAEYRTLAFGFAFTFGSSAGQTFFISLFIPSIATSTALDVEQLAYLYGAATIISAVVLPVAGRLIDRLDLVHFSVATGLFLSLASIVLSISAGPLPVFAAFAALRLFGQGLMTHAAMTAISRHFHSNRGKALSITSLGHAAGEALLPLAALALMGMAGWRVSFATFGVILGALVALVASYQVRSLLSFRRAGGPTTSSRRGETGEGKSGESESGARPIWQMRQFWASLPGFAAIPFTLTALIFHQGLLASGLGLPLATFAAGFVLFAVMQVPGSVLGGKWTDRYSARSLLPWHVAPAMLGIALLALAGSAWAVIIYLALAGFANGWSNVLRSAAIAEMVPATQLGSARSLAASATVLSTAVGPALFGFLHTLGWSADVLLWTAFALLALASASTFSPTRAPSRKSE
jgi:MFS family permease